MGPDGEGPALRESLTVQGLVSGWCDSRFPSETMLFGVVVCCVLCAVRCAYPPNIPRSMGVFCGAPASAYNGRIAPNCTIQNRYSYIQYILVYKYI